jgi:hypothetical protein
MTIIVSLAQSYLAIYSGPLPSAQFHHRFGPFPTHLARIKHRLYSMYAWKKMKRKQLQTVGHRDLKPAEKTDSHICRHSVVSGFCKLTICCFVIEI